MSKTTLLAPELTAAQRLQRKKLKAAPISYLKGDGELEVTDDRRVKGYAIIWGKINQHNERLHKGSCERSIREHGPNSSSKYKIKFLNEHDPEQPCALLEKLEEDETGLYFETKPLDDVEWANNLLTQIRSGTKENYSYGFDFVWEEGKTVWNDKDNVFDIFEIRLFEISSVSIPSGLETYTVRSKKSVRAMVEEFIAKLPSSKKLEARKIIALVQQQKKNQQSPPAGEKSSQGKANSSKPKKSRAKKGIDYDYLIKNF